MSRWLRRPGLWLTLALVGAAVVFMVLRARGPVVRTTAAVRRDLEQHVIASGRVWVPARVKVSPQVSGLVVAVGAVVGQRVEAGSLLVQIDDAEAQTAVAQARAAVEQASAKVEQLRRVGAIVANEGLRQAQTQLERAEADFQRATMLVASDAVAERELEDARRALDIARAQRNAAEAQQIAAAPLGADSRVALTAMRQAQAQLAGAEVRLAQTRIAALRPATVLERSVEVGDVVQPGRALLVLAVEGDVEIAFQPDERNLAHMSIGQKARVSPDAFPQQVFDAELHYIAPSIDPQRGSVEVRLRVPDPPKNLRPDMTVSVDLTVATREQTLTLGPDAVRGTTTPSPWVFVVEGGRIAKRDVTLGIHGEGAVEIVSGLDENDVVVLPEGRQLAPGDRVRVEPEVR